MRLEFERKAATKRARWKILSAVQRHCVEVDEDSNIRGPLMSQIWENLVNEYAIVPSADARLTGRALGIDVGGTSVKAAVVDVASGQLVTERIRERTPRRATPEALCWKKWGGEFSELLARYETYLWPDLIILGGGLARKFSKYQKFLKTNAPLVAAAMGNTAGIIGAARVGANATRTS